MGRYHGIEMRFLGPRGRRDHTKHFNPGEPCRQFAFKLKTVAEIPALYRDYMMELVKDVYWNIGDRVDMYILNANELVAALMAAAEWTYNDVV